MNPILKPDLNEVRRFLNILDPMGIFTFQTFADDKKRKSPALARVLHGTLDQHFSELTHLQQLGAGVFVMVNRGDGITHPGNKTCRTGKNVIAIRSVFVDLDGSPLEPVLLALQPDIVVESSPGRYHGHWLTNDCPLSDFTLRQKQIAQKFNGDPSVHDLPRVMRLPGFWHQKGAPFMSHIIFPK